ncbi:hypothetical protein KY361_07670 [Candidatus Woesearchaeota archaeon]|nr:hypothetical protein [Candidatus Woesearchaeota archaeon]
MKGTIEIGAKGIICTKLVIGEDVQEVKEWAEALKKLIKKEYEKTGKKVRVLTDLTECGLSKNLLMQTAISDMETEDEPYVEKSAAYTPNFALRQLANIIAKISGRKNFIVFKTREEALKWLEESEKGKSREEIIKETAHEVYRLLKASPNKTQEKILDYISRLHDYSKMESDEELQAYTLQQGAVLVTYCYLKENPSMPEEKAVKYIIENYSDLLSKYSSEE